MYLLKLLTHAFTKELFLMEEAEASAHVQVKWTPGWIVTLLESLITLDGPK